MPKTTTPARRYPERVSLAVRAGWENRIEAAANRADMSPADWIRQTLRRSLEASERAGGQTGSTESRK